MAQEIVQLGLYQGPLPTPPLKVPPEDVSLWTETDTIQVNKEHQAIFDLIADGLWGLRRLQAFTESFPKYNLDKELECLYPDNEIDSVAVNKLVICGLEIAREELLLEQQQLASVPEQGHQQPAKECLSEPDSQLSPPSCVTDLSQVDRKNIDKQEEISVHLSQVDRTPSTKEETVLQLGNGDNGKVGLLRSKKMRIKDKRQEKLSKFQQKLVQTSGLPP